MPGRLGTCRDALRDQITTETNFILRGERRASFMWVLIVREHFIVTVKEPGHTALFDKAFDAPRMQTATVADLDDKGLEHEFHWCDDVPLNASNPDVLGTLVSWTVTRVGPHVGKTKEKRRGWEKTESWFTSACGWTRTASDCWASCVSRGLAGASKTKPSTC